MYMYNLNALDRILMTPILYAIYISVL